jgi:hypothetical protein
VGKATVSSPGVLPLDGSERLLQLTRQIKLVPVLAAGSTHAARNLSLYTQYPPCTSPPQLQKISLQKNKEEEKPRAIIDGYGG